VLKSFAEERDLKKTDIICFLEKKSDVPCNKYGNINIIRITYPLLEMARNH